MARNGFRWINWARDLHLKTPQKVTLLVIAAYANGEGEAWPSYDTLAEETGLHRVTVIRVLRSLMADGYLRRNGRHNGRTNVWLLTGAQQPMLMPPESSPRATPEEPKGLQRMPSRGSPVLHEGLPSASRNNQGTAIGTVQRSPPDGEDLCRPDGGTLKSHIERFLGAEKPYQQVAALIDLSRAEGVRLKNGRAASIVKRYGHGQAVIDAIFAAKANRVLEPNDWIEKVLGNGRRRLQEAEGRPRGRAQPAATARAFDTEAWKQYAASDG